MEGLIERSGEKGSQTGWGIFTWFKTSVIDPLSDWCPDDGTFR